MKYNWSTMTPRERDALVAEKVMGLEVGWIRHQSYNTLRVGDSHWTPPSYILGSPRWSKEPHNDVGINPYSETETYSYGGFYGRSSGSSPKCIDYQEYGFLKEDENTTEPPLKLLNYTTSISAAWEVVEKMSLYYNNFIMERTGSYLVQFQSGTYFVPAPTAPKAICLAALIAVGVEVE